MTRVMPLLWTWAPSEAINKKATHFAPCVVSRVGQVDRVLPPNVRGRRRGRARRHRHFLHVSSQRYEARRFEFTRPGAIADLSKIL